MDFKDEIKSLGDRVPKLKEQIHTEEATKNAFIMPFIRALGYDVFNPLEVVPEYVTDIGTKKGEKIDYAIFRNGQPTILVECKHWAQNLDIHDGQLLRYFHVSKAKFALLTNGIIYRFYSDLVAPNKMDEKPFLEFNICEIKDAQVEELKKFHKSYFDIDKIISSASELKYLSELKHLLVKELAEPSPDFVRHFAKQAYQGVVTAKVLEQFTDLLKRSILQHNSDLVTERLNAALKQEKDSSNPSSEALDETSAETKTPEKKIETTAEEMEGFMIIKSILRKRVAPERITFRDVQSYFGISLDDHQRKTICRLYFTPNKKSITFMDAEKREIRFEISTIDELFNYEEKLISVVDELEKQFG